MNKQLLSSTVFCLFFFALLTALPVEAGKKKCKKLLNKLHNVQSLQRQANSLKKSNSLKKREDKARKKWWRCEKGK